MGRRAVKGQDTLFSSEKQDWETPQYLFDYFNRKYHFEVDLAASADNAKCPYYYSVEDDSLKQDWNGWVGWCNPEYNNIEPFLKKAVESDGVFAFLLPARTCRNWFHDYVLPHASEIYWLKGRIKFEGAKASAPFPSIVVVFGAHTGPNYHSLNLKEIMAGKKQAQTIENANALRDFIRNFYEEEGFPPTKEEMADALGVKNVNNLLNILVAEGKVIRGPNYPYSGQKQGKGRTALREYVVV